MKKIMASLAFLIFISWASTQTIEETLADIKSTKAELVQTEVISNQRIAEIKKIDPLFEPKSQFETDAEYSVRVKQAESKIVSTRKNTVGDIEARLTNLYDSTFETLNIRVTLKDYDATKKIYNMLVEHFDYRKEKVDIEVKVTPENAKDIYTNWDKVIKKGILVIDNGDIVGLAKVIIYQPISGVKIESEPIPYISLNEYRTAFTASEREHIEPYFSDLGDYFLLKSIDYSSHNSANNHCIIIDIINNSVVAEFTFPKAYDKSIYKNSAVNRTVDVFMKWLKDTASSRNLHKFFEEYHIDKLQPQMKIDSFISGYSSLRYDFVSSCYKYVIFNAYLSDSLNRDLYVYKMSSLNTPLIEVNGAIFAYFSNDSRFILVYRNDYRADKRYYEVYDLETSKLFQSFKDTMNDTFSPDRKYQYTENGIVRTREITSPKTKGTVVSTPPLLSANVTFFESTSNNYLEALEKGKLTISITNSGAGAGKGINIKLSPNLIKGLNYNNSFISEVPAGETVSVDIPIEAYVDVAEATHTLTISFEEQNGFPPNPCELQFSTKAYQKPVIAISDVGIEDSNANGKIETGEMVSLTIRVTNQGVGDASGAYAKFYPGENVFLTEKYTKIQALGDLKPNQTKDIQLEFFVNERCVNEIPLYVDFTEATGLATVNKLRIPITKTDIARPVSRIIVTGVEQDNVISNEPDLNIDIERTIPGTLKLKADTYAVILGLETYSSIPMVRFASRDATWMKEYATKALGIPESNIYFKTNDQITKNEFDKVFGSGGWLDKRITAGKSEVIFYYAGHGVPAKDNKAYLVPYDGDPNYAMLTCFPVEQIYTSLNRMKLKHSLVIMDACFTGMNRDNQPLFADARPVFLKADLPSGFANLSILAGAASDQMSNAYPDKKHGLFSYFLMKGMQGVADSNQDKKLTLQELGDYVKTEVSKQAGFLDKEQIPELSTSVPDLLLIEY